MTAEGYGRQKEYVCPFPSLPLGQHTLNRCWQKQATVFNIKIIKVIVHIQIIRFLIKKPLHWNNLVSSLGVCMHDSIRLLH